MSRLDRARDFLEESVFASRDLSHRVPAESGGQCGLGGGPALPIGFSPRQEAALQAFAPRLTDAQRQAAAEHAGRWVRLQDGLDRRRNHFLRDFRDKHGYTRSEYSPEVLAEYQAGLDTINHDNDQKLADAAQALLEALQI